MPSEILQRLLERGVVIPHPDSVYIAADVNPDRIAAGVTLYPGSRVSGAASSIGPGSEVGVETPATVDNCQLGAGVSLKGGFFSGATFLDGSNVGCAAHVRPGTLLEEESSCAHAAGLKQTILFPYVTLGSLINFCDCLMAGGTSRRDHSEVGSSYIHFNFTPHRDKATASLIGDVPRGVFADQAAIFLGGQGGLVGPCRIAYGCVIPAGAIHRQDALEPGQLLNPLHLPATRSGAYNPDTYGPVERVITNNLIYMGNIRALQEWYRRVRKGYMARDEFSLACYEGAQERLKEIWKERLARLGELADKLVTSAHILKTDQAKHAVAIRQQESFIKAWPALLEKLSSVDAAASSPRERDTLLKALPGHPGPYLEAVRSLDPKAKAAGAAWLQAVVDTFAGSWQPPR